MLTLAPALLAAFAVPSGETPAPHLTLSIAATDVQVRLPIENWTDDPQRLALLRRSGGEFVLAAGYIGTEDLRITIHGGPVPSMDGEKARHGALGDRLLGMGLSTISGFAAAKTMRQLKAPYREFDRHVFMIGAGALAHVQTIALEGEDPEKFGDERFEQMVKDSRFAVVRRTDWDDMPARYLELSHAAAMRKDGATWLLGQANAETADWLVKFVAFEHAVSAQSTDEAILELGGDVRAQLISSEKRTREEDACLLLVEDGLGITLLRTGDAASAPDHLAMALDLAQKFGPRTVARMSLSLACVPALKKDVDGVVALLEPAYAVDPALRYRFQHEPLLKPVHDDVRVQKLLEVRLDAKSNRSLGR